MAANAIAGLIGLSQDSVLAPPASTLPTDPRSALRAAQAAAAVAVPFSQNDLPSQHVLDSQDLSRTPVPLDGGGGGGGYVLLPGTGGALPAGVGGAALDLSEPAPPLAPVAAAAPPPAGPSGGSPEAAAVAAIAAATAAAAAAAATNPLQAAAHRLSIGSRPPSGGGATAPATLPSARLPKRPRPPKQPNQPQQAAAAAAPPTAFSTLAAVAGLNAPPPPSPPAGPRSVRRGPMDEMRQLVRILVKLMPHSAAYVLTADEGGGNRLAETEVKHYLACTLGDAPPPEWGLPGGWGDYLAALFSWVAGRDISVAEAMACARRLPGRSWEAVDGEMRRLGMAPATWPLPLTRAGLAGVGGGGGGGGAGGAAAPCAPDPAAAAALAAAVAADATGATPRPNVPYVAPLQPVAADLDLTTLTEMELWHICARALSLAGARAGTAHAAAAAAEAAALSPGGAAPGEAAAAAASTASHIVKLKTQVAYHVGVLVARGEMVDPAAAAAAGPAGVTGRVARRPRKEARVQAESASGGAAAAADPSGEAGGGKQAAKKGKKEKAPTPTPGVVEGDDEVDEAGGGDRTATASPEAAAAPVGPPPPPAEDQATPAAAVADPPPSGLRRTGRGGKGVPGAPPLSMQPTAKRARKDEA